MKILYGVQGTGNGHISRARIMAHHFKRHNAQVTFLFSGRCKSKLFDMDIFGDYLYRKGLTFTTKSGAIDYLETARNNHFIQFAKDIANLDLSEYHLVLSDFEPITAWAANMQQKPLIATGHQYAFGENTPVCGENFIAKNVMKMFAPAKVKIGQHWHPYHNHILPPIIDTSLAPLPCHGAIVVYLPFEDQKHITRLLRNLKQYRFIQYSSDIEDGIYENVTLRKANHDGFKRDLCGARGVICNSGFELNSECIHLGIPVLTRPVSGQMEQLSNAKALQQLGFAEVMDQVNSRSIGKWLQRIQTSQSAQPKTMPDVAEQLVQWILAGRWNQPQKLSYKLWQEYSFLNQTPVQFPEDSAMGTSLLPELNLPALVGKVLNTLTPLAKQPSLSSNA